MVKRLLIILALCASAFGQTTTTITGNLKNPGTGTVSSGTFVRFFIQGCGGNNPRVNGTAIIAPTLGSQYYFDMVPNSSGAISGTLYSNRDAAGTGNGQLECGGSFTATWYAMQIYVNGKGGPLLPFIAKSGATVDISNITPLSTNPVVTAPTGDGTYLRLDAGNSPVTGATTFNSTIAANGKITASASLSAGPDINRDLWVGLAAGQYSSLAACYAAISVTGQSCHVIAGWTETLSSNLTMNLNYSGFIFHGAATITMGSNQIIVSQGTAGAYIKGLSSVDSNTMQGLKFVYTGTGTGMVVGSTAGRTTGLEFENFALDISGAGSSAIGINWIDVNAGCGMKRVYVKGAGGSNTQIGYQLDSDSVNSFQGDCTFIEPQSSGVLRDWVINGNTQENTWTAGQGFLHATGTSICFDFEGTSGSVTNNVYNFNCSGPALGAKFAGSVQGNKVEMNGGSATTASASFGSSTSNNVAIVPNSGTVQWGGTNNVFITNGVTLGMGDLLLNHQGSSGALTGNGSDQTLYTYSIPANYIGPGKGVRIRIQFQHNSGSAGVVYKFNFGSSITESNTGPTTTGTRYTAEYIVYNNPGSQSAQQGSNFHNISSDAFSTFCCASGTENTQNAVTVSFTFNVANTDQVTPQSFSVELIQ